MKSRSTANRQPRKDSSVHRQRRYSLRRKERGGVMISIELIVVLPLVVAFALTILQFMLIGSAHYRVQAACTAAAEAAAEGGSMLEVHDAAGKMLGPSLQKLYQTQMEYSPRKSNHSHNRCEKDDSVVVCVRIPMLAPCRNYLGLFGGDISPLHIQAVCEKKVMHGFDIPGY